MILGGQGQFSVELLKDLFEGGDHQHAEDADATKMATITVRG